MACFGGSFGCLQLVAFSLAIFFINPLSAKPRPNVTNEEINTICTKTQAPSFCFQVLTNETLHANETNLHGLAKISIGLAVASAEGTQTAITPLVKQAKNYTKREGYTLCSQNYGEALSTLRRARKLLAKHDYRGLRVAALAAVEKAKACENHVKTAGYNVDYPLHEKNKEFKRYCNIIWAISNRLVESN